MGPAGARASTDVTDRDTKAQKTGTFSQSWVVPGCWGGDRGGWELGGSQVFGIGLAGKRVCRGV